MLKKGEVINIYGSPRQGDGYLGATENIAMELEKSGYDIRLLSQKFHKKKYMSPLMQKIVNKPTKIGRVGIMCSLPITFPLIMNQVKIGITMFETDSLPRGLYKNEINGWSGKTGNPEDILNKMDEVWVPCQQNLKVFKDNRVTSKIRVLHLGVDVDIYKNMKEHRAKTRSNRPFTFLMVAKITNRKNPGMAISAFMDLFKGKNAKLILKTYNGTLSALDFPDDINIEIIDSYYSQAELLKLYAESDAFVFPSRGEGFGLTPLEAMSTGLPTIFPNHTGMSEYANEKYNYPIGWEYKTPSRYKKNFGETGSWFEPKKDELMEKMLEVYNNESEAIKKGNLASKWIRHKWTYKNTAKKVISYLQEIL